MRGALPPAPPAKRIEKILKTNYTTSGHYCCANAITWPHSKNPLSQTRRYTAVFLLQIDSLRAPSFHISRLIPELEKTRPSDDWNVILSVFCGNYYWSKLQC